MEEKGKRAYVFTSVEGLRERRFFTQETNNGRSRYSLFNDAAELSFPFALTAPESIVWVGLRNKKGSAAAVESAFRSRFLWENFFISGVPVGRLVGSAKRGV